MSRILIGMAAFAILMFSAENSGSWEDSIRAWQKHRDVGLRAETGWLTLAGLFWLKPGDNTIGSAPGNDIVLPKSAPAHVGKLHMPGGNFSVSTDPSANGSSLVFGPKEAAGKVTLIELSGAHKELSYSEDHPDVVTFGSVSFVIIKRGDRLGVRVRDTESPVRKNFEGMSYFPINAKMRFEAKLMPDVKKVPILNVLGQTEMEESPGWVEFTHEGHAYRLRPIYEDTANGKTLYFLFKDLTNKTQTYPAGRMLNVPLPVDGKVDLDFNKAYNPPCTFTPYATCPLPPKENHLPFAVDAGELRYKDGHPYEISSK